MPAELARRFELEGRKIDIWPVVLSADAAETAVSQSLLDPEESEAASRRTGEIRRRYVLSHGLLRALAGAYSRLPPSGIRYTFGAKGKPRLRQFDFNVSHSGELALYAFTLGCEIGIDVEAIRVFPDMSAIARQYFCPEETGELHSLSDAERIPAFFRCWTRKEAYIKAEGEGLSIPLDAFRVTLLPQETSRIVHIGNCERTATAWTMHDLQVAEGHAAALAYRDFIRPLRVSPMETAGALIRRFRSAGLV